MIHSTLNLNAYENVESLDNYRNDDELEKYRMKRLGDMQKTTRYIEEYIYRDRPLRVLEYCSGSSCLLYSMETHGILERGVGIEISPSRHAFAERWKKDHSFQKVENLNINVKDCDFDNSSFDLIVMVDSAFNYFYHEAPSLPDEVLAHSWKFLRQDGFILFDMMTRALDRERCKEDGFYTYWVEFPEDNPFRFGLYRQEILDCEKSLIFTQNVYVRRDGFIDDSKKEITRFYSLEALENLLGSKGFRNIKVAANFNNAEYIEGKSERLVLLALRI